MALRTASPSRYAAVAALTDVSLEVLPGEVHALLGENGAGKSTLMDVASGAIQPDAGTIAVNGETVDELTPATAAELGIAIVHQHPAVLPDLTVEENLRVAVPPRPSSRSPAGRARAWALLDEVGLHRPPQGPCRRPQRRPEAPAGGGQGAGAPAAPADPRRTDGTARRRTRSSCSSTWCARPPRQGTAVVYITHRLAEVRELADRVTVLRDGRHRGTAEVADVTDDELLAMIVGRQLDSTFPPKHLGADDEQPCSPSTAVRARFSDVSLHRPARRDHRDRRCRRQRPERTAARAGRPRLASRRPSHVDGKKLTDRQLHNAGVHAGRPSARGPDDDAVGARERRGLPRSRSSSVAGS